MFTTVLFDLDGTLIDSTEGIAKSIQHALRRAGRAVPPAEDLLWCIGPPFREAFPRLFGTDDPALIEHAIGLYRERFAAVGKTESFVYPDVPPVLARLRARGHRLVIATTKPVVFAREWSVACRCVTSVCSVA